MQIEVIKKELGSTSYINWDVVFSTITPIYVYFTLNNGAGTGFSTESIYCGPNGNIGSFSISGKKVTVTASGGSYVGLIKTGTIVVVGLGN